jgi:hypothetical protein
MSRVAERGQVKSEVLAGHIDRAHSAWVVPGASARVGIYVLIV